MHYKFIFSHLKCQYFFSVFFKFQQLYRNVTKHLFLFSLVLHVDFLSIFVDNVDNLVYNQIFSDFWHFSMWITFHSIPQLFFTLFLFFSTTFRYLCILYNHHYFELYSDFAGSAFLLSLFCRLHITEKNHLLHNGKDGFFLFILISILEYSSYC